MPPSASIAGIPTTGKTRGSIRWWEGRADPSLLIDRLEFSDSVRDILPGIGTRLIVRALSATGTEIPLRAPLTWASSDTLIATVDSAGEVRVRSIGTVTISATLVGRRSVSKALTVVGKPPVDLLSERWDDHWTDRWLAWGLRPGGCFFVGASAELDDRPGPPRDALVRASDAEPLLARLAGQALAEAA